jgi:RHS repeat-associated protein
LSRNADPTVWIDQPGCLQPGDLYGGGQVTCLSSVDNDTHRIGSATLGVTGVLSAGTSGTLFFDAFESRRSTYIGQAGMRMHYLGKSMPKAGLMKLIAVQPDLAGRYAPLYDEIALDAPTDYLFTGARYEKELGLYLLGSRWLDPTLGRFIQADTIIPEASQGVQAWDRYAYVNNSPVNYTDPTGHDLEQMIFDRTGKLPKSNERNKYLDDLLGWEALEKKDKQGCGGKGCDLGLGSSSFGYTRNSRWSSHEWCGVVFSSRRLSGNYCYISNYCWGVYRLTRPGSWSMYNLRRCFYRKRGDINGGRFWDYTD